jgi:O-antigen/teichoic acid export membrane protein
VSTTRKVVFNTIAQVLGKAATTITTLLITILITRRFGPVGYGDFTVMMAYSALFYIVTDFGLNAIVTRDLSADEGKTALYFRNLLALRLVMAAVLFAVGVLVLLLFPYSQFVKVGIVISLLTIFTQALYTSGNAVFQTKLRYDLSVVASALGSLAILLLTAFFVMTGRGILAVVASYVIGGVLMVLASLVFIQRMTGAVGFAIKAKVWRYLFLAALPLGITTIFTVVLQRADAIMLSLMTSSDVVGFYGAAYKIFEFALVFPTFFINSVYPVMVRHFKESHEKLLSTTKLSGLVLFVISLVGMGLGYLLAPLMIRIIAGPEFASSVLALRLLLLGLPVFYLSALFLWLLITLGKQNQIPFVYAIGAAANIILNFVFIPRYSLYAAAVTTWVSELLILVLLAILSYRVLRRR